MRGAIFITLFGVIVFLIASFFIFFAYDKLVSSDMACILQETACDGNMSDNFTMGLYIIFSLLALMVSAAYVMIKNIFIDMQYRKKKAQTPV